MPAVRVARLAAVGLSCAWVCAWAAPARAEGFLHELAHQARLRLDAAVATRAPALVPPVPVIVRWKAQKLGAIDVGATLVALAAADLDGDGKAELYAVTPREVVVIGVSPHGLKELGRVPFGGELAVPAPRDPVGTAIVDGDAVVATVSTWQRGVRVQLRGKSVVGGPDAAAGFPVCAARLQLAPGRNYLVDQSGDIYGARCREVTDALGKPVHVTAVLATTGKLAVTLAHDPPVRHDYTGVGVAFDIADIDRDGTPEVIYSGAGAPGDADAVKVVTFGSDDKKPAFRRSFTGGVAGVVAVDLDGDGALEVVVAVRLVGSTKIDLWRLN